MLSWPLAFHGVDPYTCCLMAVSDATLKHACEDGSLTHGEEVPWQAGFLVFMAEPSLHDGGGGKICLMDYRSLGLRRICRSSYVTETDVVEKVFEWASQGSHWS